MLLIGSLGRGSLIVSFGGEGGLMDRVMGAVGRF